MHTQIQSTNAQCVIHRETIYIKPVPPPHKPIRPPSPLWQTYQKEGTRSEQSSREDVSPQEGQQERDKNKRRKDRNKMRLQRKKIRKYNGREGNKIRQGNICAKQTCLNLMMFVMLLIPLWIYFFQRTQICGTSTISLQYFSNVFTFTSLNQNFARNAKDMKYEKKTSKH